MLTAVPIAATPHVTQRCPPINRIVAQMKTPKPTEKPNNGKRRKVVAMTNRTLIAIRVLG